MTVLFKVDAMADRSKPAIPRTPDKNGEFENLLSLLEKEQEELAADPEFDIYEKVGDNYVWRALSIGLGRAMHTLKELSAGSSNEFVVMHTFSSKVIVRINSSKA